MVQQNGGRFRRLVKNHLKNRFWSESNFFSGNVIALCVDSDEKISKIVMATLNLKKSKKNNFAGGVGCENFIRC